MRSFWSNSGAVILTIEDRAADSTGVLHDHITHPDGFVLGTRAEDEEAVDCYLLTKDGVKSGTVVECEPIGLLEQDEDGEIDHKVLAAMPGQPVEVGQQLLKEIGDFIQAVFAEYPEVQVHVGRILPPEAARNYIEKFRNA